MNNAEMESSENDISTQEWLTIKEASEYLRIPVGTLRNWTSNGRIPYRKIGRCVRYKRSELRDLLNRNRRGGPYDS